MVIFSCVGSTQGGWSALDVIPEIEETKHQSDSGWIQNYGHFKLDFEFISLISNSQVEFWNGLITLCNCLQMTITF